MVLWPIRARILFELFYKTICANDLHNHWLIPIWFTHTVSIADLVCSVYWSCHIYLSSLSSHVHIRKCPSLIFHANGYLTLNQQKGCPIFFYQSLWQLACLLPSSTYLLTNCPSSHLVHGQQQIHSILFFCGATSGLSPTSGVWLLFPPCPVCCQVLGQPLFLFLSGVQWGATILYKIGKGANSMYWPCGN